MTAEELAKQLEAGDRSGIWYQGIPAAAMLRSQSAEIERLEAIEVAARNLVKVKGRYHTEQAFKALAALLEKSNG